MQITLNQTEIEDAIRNFVLGHISIGNDTCIEIDLKAGRGDNGFTATLDLNRSSYGVVGTADTDVSVVKSEELPSHDPKAEVPIPEKKTRKTEKPNKASKESSADSPEPAAEDTVTLVDSNAEVVVEDDPMTSPDCIPDEPAEEEKPQEAPAKPSIFQFNAASKPAE